MKSAPISQRAQRVPPALSIYMNEIVYRLKREGRDITTLSLGEAFFDIPLYDFAKTDFVRGYHYSDSQGIPELRQVIGDFYRDQYGTTIDWQTELLVTAGSKVAIYLAILATVDPGCEVLIHEPAWLSYQEHVRLADGETRFIPYDIPVTDFADWFSDRTRMLIINNPNNPAGRVYSDDELRTLVSVCKRNGVWLLVDEAYSDFLPEGQFRSALDFDADREVVIVANSLSKNLGMSGWRIGYIISNSQLINRVLCLNQHIITCAPTVLQLYIARYFDVLIQGTLPQAREVADKRSRVAARVEALGLSALPGCATFYFFVHIGDFPASSLDLSLYLLLFKNIAVVSGSAYGASTERFLRVSIGTESEERIDEALAVLKNTLVTVRDVSTPVQKRLAEMGIPPARLP